MNNFDKGLLIFMNSIFVLSPMMVVLVTSLATKYGIGYGVASAVVGFNICIFMANYGLNYNSRDKAKSGQL